MNGQDRYRLAGGLTLELRGPRRVRAHFAREYSEALRSGAGDGVPDACVEFRARPGPAAERERYKSVAWGVALGAPHGAPLTAEMSVSGIPLRFGLSLVQGYFVEPLLSVAAARRGTVLLPAAAAAEGDGALLVLGSSGAGKSTLMVRALAAGTKVLADDQVLVAGTGECSRFPRRMRFYSDLPRMAPAAYERLALGRRAALRARGAVRQLSRGYVAPSLAVAAHEVADPGPPGPLPLRRIVLLQRDPAGREVAAAQAHPDDAVGRGIALLDEQRARLAVAGAGAWVDALATTREVERGLLAAAFEGLPVERVDVPGALEPADAVAAVARHLGTERR